MSFVGTVFQKDTNNPIGGANVILISNKNGQSYRSVSSSRGIFVLANVPSGKYQLTVRALGFKDEATGGTYDGKGRHNVFMVPIEVESSKPSQTPPSDPNLIGKEDPESPTDLPAEAREIEVPPPVLRGPLYECGMAIRVEGYVAKAEVVVTTDANGGEVLAKFSAWTSPATVDLPRPLKEGETITAAQIIEGKKSRLSNKVIVGRYEGPITPPRVYDDLIECGVIVRVTDVIPGSRVKVFQDNREIGQRNSAGDVVWVWVRGLQANKPVTARQFFCPNGPDGDRSSDFSAEAWPATSPRPPIAPRPIDPVAGNESIVLADCLPGSRPLIEQNGTRILRPGVWTSPWRGSVRYPVSPVNLNGGKISASQALCTISPPSIDVDPIDPREIDNSDLPKVTVREPVCPDSSVIAVEGTIDDGIVVIYISGKVVGFASGANGVTYVSVTGTKPGLTVAARQYVGGRAGPLSTNPVTISGTAIGSPEVTVRGAVLMTDQDTGEMFYGITAENRHLISVSTTTCCEEGGKAIIEVAGEQVFRDLLDDGTGSYQALFVFEEGLSIGEISVIIRTQCGGKSERKLKIVRGEANIKDASAPSVNFSVTVDGSTYPHDSRSPSQEIEVIKCDSSAVIEAIGIDNEGLEKVEIMIMGGSAINGPLSKVASDQAPIPTRLTTEGAIGRIEPNSSVDIVATATNFGQLSTTTSPFRIKVKAPQQSVPTISGTSPQDGMVRTGDRLTLKGRNFTYCTAATTVEFIQNGNSIPVNILGGSDRQQRIIVPSVLVGGKANVVVKVGALVSNAYELTITDFKLGVLKPFSVNNVKMQPATFGCNNAAGGYFEKIEVTASTASIPQFIGVFYANNRIVRRETFTPATAGGVAISPKCNVGLSMSLKAPGNGVGGAYADYNLFLFAPDTNNRLVTKPGSIQVTGENFQVLISTDENLVGVIWEQDPSLPKTYYQIWDRSSNKLKKGSDVGAASGITMEVLQGNVVRVARSGRKLEDFTF